MTVEERLQERDAEIEQLRAVIEELLPYARATIGLPENAWSPDNVILKARAILANGNDG